MKAIFLFFIISALALLTNPASAGITVTDAEAIYEANLSTVSIPTNPYPVENIFTVNIEAIFSQDLSSVSIPTQPAAIEEIFIVNEEAKFDTSLFSVSIPTQPSPIEELFIHLEEAKAYNELTFPKELINDIALPNITDVTVTNITGNSATIKWNTDEIADSLVKYGKVSGIYTESVSDPLFVKNHSIELTGLLSKTTYYFVVSSSDRSGNSNQNSEHTFTTALDTAPPASITDLHNTTYAQNYINWTWTDPSDTDFSKAMVYFDGIFQTNVSKGVQYYNAAGLNPDTEHTVGTHTMDTSGNINQTWVNYTARTASVAGGTTISIASQAVNPNSTVTAPIIASNITDLSAFSVTLSYNPAVVWVDRVTAGDFGTPISNINNATGSTNISGGSITGKSGNLVLANVVLRAVGTAGQTSPLNISVTDMVDSNGNAIPATVLNGTLTIQTSFTISANRTNVSIATSPISPTPVEFTVMLGSTPASGAVITLGGAAAGSGTTDNGKAVIMVSPTMNGTITAAASYGANTSTTALTAKGDVNGDSRVSITDALFIAQYTAGLRVLDSNTLVFADVSGDGKASITDALFIAQATAGIADRPVPKQGN